MSDGVPRTWSCGPSVFGAFPESGARLAFWRINLAGGREREVIHWPAEADPGALAHVRGGNPILFPFAGQSFHEGQPGFWRGPDGRVRPIPQHGIARQAPFEVIEDRDDGFSARLLLVAEAKAAYPFHFDFRVHYRFTQLSLACTLELENRDETSLPWAPGHHFYFTLPWGRGQQRGDYRILADARRLARIGATGMLEPIEAEPPDFGDPAAINLLRLKLRKNEIRFGPRSEEEDIRIRLTDAPRPHPWFTLVTWTESADSPFYCVEPWMGPPNAAGLGKGLHHVAPGETAAWTVQVDV